MKLLRLVLNTLLIAAGISLSILGYSGDAEAAHSCVNQNCGSGKTCEYDESNSPFA